MQGQERVHHVNFCSFIREECNIFHSQSTVKTLESASKIPYRHNKNPQRTMQGSRKIINRFKERNGTVICKELKGITDGVVKRECLDCVRDAAAFLEAELPESYVTPGTVVD